MQRNFWAGFASVSLATLILLPPTVFTFVLLLEGFSPVETVSTVISQYQGPRQNPLANSVLGLIPLLPLVIIVAVYRIRKGTQSIAIAVGGGLGIALTLLWSNLEFWPNFLPGREYPGFPHGLEIVIGAVFFAPLAMLAGVLAAFMWVRSR